MQRKWRRFWKKDKQVRTTFPQKSSKGNDLNIILRLAKKLLPPAAAVSILFAAMSGAYAIPTGGQVTAGAGSIAQNGNTMNIKQSTDKMSINWQTFNIAANETVNFLQPGANSIALNRVLGNNASSIYGHLNANGKVFLINPNGILFAPGAQVNVGGLVASTLNIAESDFQAGNYYFCGSGGPVVNQGKIIAANGGYVALFGNQVSNQGVIVANQGMVALVAEMAATLDFVNGGYPYLQTDLGGVGVTQLPDPFSDALVTADQSDDANKWGQTRNNKLFLTIIPPGVNLSDCVPLRQLIPNQ